MNVERFRRSEGHPPYVFGHRGVRGRAPENTMAAFALAAEEGVDGIELDVRLCRTGEIAVCHDSTLARFNDGRDPRAIADLSRSELARTDVGEGQPVPLLDEVLRWAFGQNLRVNVEMKRDVPNRRAVVLETARLLGDLGGGLANVIVSSFDPWMLAYLGWLLPRALRGYLFSQEQPLERSGWAALPLFADAVHPARELAIPERYRKWRKHGKLVNVWTVNDETEAKTLAALGVDAIISDVPGAIARAVR